MPPISQSFRNAKPVAGFNYESLPDPEAEVIQALFDRIQFLEQEIRASENLKGFSHCVKLSKIAGK